MRRLATLPVLRTPLCAVLARPVPPEQEAEERATLERCWEMAAVMDFLEVFRGDLNLGRAFTWAELESSLIFSPGRDGLLADLHIVGGSSQPCSRSFCRMFLHPPATPMPGQMEGAS